MSLRERLSPTLVGRAYRRWVRPHAVWWVIAGVTVLGAAATGIALWQGPSGKLKWSGDFWLDVAQAGIGVVAIGVVGGGVALAWEELRRQRADKAVRHEQLRAELGELVALYNDVKAVRRTMRSLGLDTHRYVPEPHSEVAGSSAARDPAVAKREARERKVREDRRHIVGCTVQLTAEQVSGFHEQMQRLNMLQLRYETKIKLFDQARLLEDASGGSVIQANLTKIEEHLNSLVDLWANRGWTIEEGTRLDAVSDALQGLHRQDSFNPNVSNPMHKITAVINRELFGEAKSSERPRGFVPLGGRLRPFPGARGKRTPLSGRD